MKNDLAKMGVAVYVVICLVACVPSNSTNNEVEKITSSQIPAQHIFFQAIIQTERNKESILNQIWRIQNGIQTELLFELENTSGTSLSEVFSEQELTAFDEWYSFTGKETYPPATEIYPGIISRQITLSPIDQKFAWIEAVFWGPPESTIGFAMIRVMTLDLTGDRKILHETSRHPNGMFGIERNSLDGLAWSPDGQKIVFVEGSQGEHQAKIVDVATGFVENLGEPDEGGIFSSWSPDGASIVMNSPDTLNILSTTGAPPQKDIAGSWGVIDGLDWSPDGKTIIFAASKDNFPERLKLYVINVSDKDLVELPLDENSTYETPKWSPDNKLIAVNVGSTRLEEIDKLLVYNVETQAIVATLEGKRSSQNFYWSDDGRTILLTMGSPPDAPRTIELFYWQENRTEVIPFPEGIEDGVAIGISSG